MSEVSASLPQAAEDAQRDALLHGRLGDPFAFLGPHANGKEIKIRSFQPGAQAVRARCGDQVIELSQQASDGLFTGKLPIPPKSKAPAASEYVLEIVWPGVNGETVQVTEDPYAFDLLLGELDLHLIAEGRHRELGRCLGALPMVVDGIEGTRFAVWAPNATRVSVVGDFNGWDGRRHPMRARSQAGVWELFIPRLAAGERYKYELLDINGQLLPQKADPIARATE